MRAKTAYRLNAALILLWVLVDVVVWPDLPDRIPIHFGLGGEADWWVRTSVPAWFGLPMIAAGLALFLRGIAWLAARAPETWNVPEKERFLALSPEARRPIVGVLETYLAWVAVVVTLVFAAVQLGVYLTAVGRTTGIPIYLELFMLAAITAILGGALLLGRRLRHRIREAAASR